MSGRCPCCGFVICGPALAVAAEIERIRLKAIREAKAQAS